MIIKPLNETPLTIAEAGEETSFALLPFAKFPIVADFYVNTIKTAVFGYQLEYRSDLYGTITTFPWWDRVEHRFKTMADMPIGTLEQPFSDLEQGWQLYIFQHDDFVYILEGDEPICEQFSRWFKVSADLYTARWQSFLAELKSL